MRLTEYDTEIERKISRVVPRDGEYAVDIFADGAWWRIYCSPFQHRAYEIAAALQRLVLDAVIEMQEACATMAEEKSTKGKASKIAAAIRLIDPESSEYTEGLI